MIPTLLSIQFHDPADGGLTLPLQRLQNALQPCVDGGLQVNPASAVVLPEWQRGVSRVPKDSPVAICLSKLAGGYLRARVVLGRAGCTSSGEIRGVDATGSNLLGVAGPTAVPCFTGEAATVYVPLSEYCLAAVAAHDDVFQWQWRESASDPWQDLSRSKHRVCLTLDVPGGPWDLAQQPPWIEVVDQAACWAAGAVTVADAASRITRAAFALGEPSNEHPQFTYFGRSRFTDSNFFDCAAFLAALAGCPREQVLDCGAMASIVCTFANSLGASLLEVVFRRSDGGDILTHPVRCVGQAEFAPKPFHAHELAFGGPGNASDPVWDATLLVNNAGDPEAAPHGGVNATGMRFSTERDNYLARFATTNSAFGIVISPRAANRQLGSTTVRANPTAGPTKQPRPGWFYWNFRLLPDFLQWAPLRNILAFPGDALTAIDSIWTPSGDPQQKVQVVVEPHACYSDALQRLRECQSLYDTRLMQVDIGDFGLMTSEETGVLLVRGNLFVEMQVAGPIETRLYRTASGFDGKLIAPAQSISEGQPAPGEIDISAILPTVQEGVPYWYRVYADTGEIRVQEGRPHFHPAGPGEHNVYVYAYDPNGVMTPTVHSYLTE